MAKTSYRVAAPINRSILDHEIVIWPGQSTPTPMKQILFFIIAFFVILWSTMSTFIAAAGPLWATLYVIWAIISAVYLGGMLKTNELRVSSVMAVIAYLPKQARHVITRLGSNPSSFYQIAGIERIDDDGGIHFADGTVGQVYLAAGSASYLVFDEDRNAILDRVDAFWQKAKSSCSYTFITTKEPQRVHRQVANLERRNQALTIRHPDLLELQNEQHDILVKHVGEFYSSIHQYTLAKADNPEALRTGHQILEAETNDSQLMFKELVVLAREDAEAMLRMFYTGIDSDPMKALNSKRRN